mgnify:CR=1 FL=1
MALCFTFKIYQSTKGEKAWEEPKELDIKPLVEEAKAQLLAEADYTLEAEYLARYKNLLANNAHFKVPSVYPQHSTAQVLTMEYVDAKSIEGICDLPAAERSHVAEQLIDLFFKEMFEFKQKENKKIKPNLWKLFSIPESNSENISSVYAESTADWLSVKNDVSSFVQKYYQDLKDKYGDDVLFYNNSDELAKTISENTEYLSYKYLDEIKKLPEYIKKLDEAKDLSLAVIEEKSLNECIVDLEEWYSDNCNSDDEEGYKLQLIISSLKNIADKDKII